MSSNAGGRRKDENWKHVTQEEDGKWRCKHCRMVFSGKISVTRIKAHLKKEKGKGIAPCSKFDHDKDGVHNDMASGSSNPPQEEPVIIMDSIQGEARFDPAQRVHEQVLMSGLEPQNHMSGGLVNHQNNVASGFSYLPNGEARFDPAQGVQGQALTSGLESQNHMSGGLVNHQINLASRFSYLPNEARFDRAQGVQGQALTSGLELQAFPGFSQLPNGMDASIYPKDAFEPEITLLNQLVSGLERDKGDMEQHIHRLEGEGKKRKRDVSDWLDDIEDLRSRADDMKNFVHPMPSNDYRQEIKQLIGEIQRHKEEMPFVLSTDIVGENFEQNTRKMWKLLRDDQVSIIGIHGMGGVGKTLLATHVENEIKRKGAFKDVFWVTVSQNSTISKLQHDIAKRIDLKLDEDEERLRATNLCLALKEKENSVLVLDNVWNYIDFEKVGIPSGFKVIVTTRLKHVCQQMDCLPDNMIRMLPLNTYKEAEELFMLKLGYNGKPAILSPQVQKIAESVVEHCYHLPLKISVIARTMKGINEIYRWRHAKNKLEMGEEGEEVFKVLKSSYDNLMEKDLQDCFLYVALLPSLERDELIMKLVDKKLINGQRSLEKIFDEGNTILDKLKSHSLYWKSDTNAVNLALHLLKESQRRVMVKFAGDLTEKWTNDLELVNCYRSCMPEGISPFCPELSTLMLRGYLRNIPEYFFQNMNALTILHISDNERLECLPNSLSDLRSLVSLVLRACGSLKYVPPLGKLQALSRLVISYCSIDKVPEGLEKLTNLKWLDLSHNNRLGFMDVLCNLISLQYLDLRDCGHVKIKVKDVQGMKMLECFGGTFDHNDYNNYVENILDKHLGPKTYDLFLANFDASFGDSKSILPSDPRTKTVNFVSKDFPYSHVLPKDVTDVHMYYIKCQEDCLWDTMSQKTCSSLRKMEVFNCKELKHVFCLSSSCFCSNSIKYLEVLYLNQNDSLTDICKEEVLDVGPSLSLGAMFTCMKDLQLYNCDSIEKLLTPRLVLHLPNLESISVKYCNSIQEIFGDGSSSLVLPKLTTLVLFMLPRLKHVLKMLVLQLPNLESIEVKWCNSIEEIFIVGNGDDYGSPRVELPKLTEMVLLQLPKLKTVCKEIISFGSLSTFNIQICPNFDWIYPTIPFQLHVDHGGRVWSDDDDY